LLTEVQWKKIVFLLPKPRKHRKGGRRWIENRRVLEGILWILRSGARWQDLPEKYPHPSTCWRRAALPEPLPHPPHRRHAVTRKLRDLAGAFAAFLELQNAPAHRQRYGSHRHTLCQIISLL
jgi:transposase